MRFFQNDCYMKKCFYHPLLFIFFLTFLSCDNDTSSYFPFFEVDFRLSLNPGVNHTLSEIPGYYEKTERKGTEKIGYGGVLIYHTADDRFTAYDRVCPNDLSRAYLISAPDSEGVVRCNHCKSEFRILTQDSHGRPIAGPALERGRRLQPYTATRVGNEVVVSNLY